MNSELIKLREEIYKLEWTDFEIINFPDKYTDLTVHIALERADEDKDLYHFIRILSSRREILIKHIEATLPVFDWNFISIINRA